MTLDQFGHRSVEELKPNGSQTPVTKANKHEYVELYVAYKLTNQKSVCAAFAAFAAGFQRVVNPELLEFFQPQELMEMVVGNEAYDWDVFERNAEYRGEYWANHPTIRMFWEAFRSFTLPEKKKFLLFLTGSDRIPLLGMKTIKVFSLGSEGGERCGCRYLFSRPWEGRISTRWRIRVSICLICPSTERWRHCGGSSWRLSSIIIRALRSFDEIGCAQLRGGLTSACIFVMCGVLLMNDLW